jgi:hypothetical protein
MSNKQRLTVYCFRLEVVHAMRTAYRMACEEPRLKDAGDGMTAIVADKILELADAGETDPERLCSAALRRLSPKQEATALKPRNERSVPLFRLTYDSALPDGGHIDPERLYKAIRYLKEHPEQQVRQSQLRIFDHSPPTMRGAY